MSYRVRRLVFIFGAAIYFSSDEFTPFPIGFLKKMGPDWLCMSWLEAVIGGVHHIAINEGLAQQIRGKSENYIARIFSLVGTPKKL
jgi:hypothetical protein